MIIEMAYVEIDASLCKGCALCTAQCAKKLLNLTNVFNAKGYNVVNQKDANECSGCTLCALMCPEAAITVYK